ncbi:MAG: GIY-YIG nuclease family protein [Candidatus Acidiferrales bacterium]
MGSNPIGSTSFPFMPFFVYVLESETSGRYYVGQTKSVEERLAYHNANYSLALRNRGPWRLVYFEEYPTRSEAVRRERYIKSQKDRRFITHLVGARSASR